MKRLSCILLSLLFSVFVFANDPKGIFEVVNITPEGIEKEFGALEYGKNYSIVFEEGFDFSKVSKDFFQYMMVETIHDLFEHGSYLKFSGPFDYIYFDAYQSINNFSVIKTMMEEAPEKYFCVDISHSYYEHNSNDGQYYGLPYNCFADHPNLYWVHFGNFVGEDIPEGTCRNLPNLQAVFFHNEKVLRKSAFENVNPDALYIDSSLPIKKHKIVLLSEYLNAKRDQQQEITRDYRNFKSAYEFDPYSGVEWLVDGDAEYSDAWWDSDDSYDYDDYDDEDEDIPDYSEMENEEDFMDMYLDMMYESLVKDLSWDDIADWEEISKSQAKSFIDKVDYSDPESVALAYICACQFYPEKRSLFIAENHDEPFEINTKEQEFKFEDYGKVKRLIRLTEAQFSKEDDSDEEAYIIGIEIEDGDTVKKDLTIIDIIKVGDKWYVSQVGHNFLKLILLQAAFNY